MLKYVVSILVTFIFSAISAATVPVCEQGSPNKDQIDEFLSTFKGSTQPELAGFYQNSRTYADGVADIYVKTEDSKQVVTILSSYGDQNVAAKVLDCIRDGAPVDKTVSDIRKLVALSEVPVVKRRCIYASMMRGHGNSEYFCSPSGVKTSLGKPGESGACVTPQMVDYTWWAYHKAIYCMSDPAKPIDPMTIFKKFNNESTFHFQVAHDGGVGIGQLTSIAVRQVNQSGRIQKVIESQNPHCFPFQKALRRPLTDARNHCALIEPNDGFARALIYSIAYFLETRDTLMTKFKNTLERKGIEDARFANLGALAAYGPEGLKVQDRLVAALNESGNNYSRFEAAVRRKIPYIQDISEKADEVVAGHENIQRLSDCNENMRFSK